MRAVPKWRLGLRREVAILLPVSLLVLIVISTFTLFSYRSAVEVLSTERRAEAAGLARDLARRLADADGLGAHELRRLAPQARAVAVMDAQGLPLVETGTFPETNLLAPLPPGERPLRRPVGLGPDPAVGDVVVGLAPLGPEDERRYLRVDLPAGVLAAQSRALPFLSVLVLGVNSGILLLVLVFVRHLLVPYESLLDRARQLAEMRQAQDRPRDPDDEVAFLVRTFDEALATLTEPGTDSVEDDIAALRRTLSPSLESGVLLLDQDGRLLTLNPLGRSLLGLPESEPLAGDSLESALARHPSLVDVLVESVRGGHLPQRKECTVQVHESPLTLGLTVHPLRREDTGIRGYLVLFADLTEVERQAEERRLAESLARIGELTAGVAHELRNSLATMRGYLTLAEGQPATEGEGTWREDLREIRREADQLQRIVEDFLSFARPGSARLEVVDVNRLVHRAASDPALDAAAISIRAPTPAPTEDPPPPPLIQGDPQLLERALRNVLYNAVEAQREAGRDDPVGVRVETSAGELLVVVEDRGGGIAPELRDKLFVPFATGRKGGVGLGLALAHRIVELHGGRIRLEDRRGGGTRAVLSFPADRFVTKGNDREDTAASEREALRES